MKTLVVLAGGLGRRFGGHKPAAAVGPTVAPLVAYALHDAWLAGFQRAVMVVHPDHDRTYLASLAGQFRDRISLDWVPQQLGRQLPWGTAHALLAAREMVDGAFMVINADDFYGRESYRLMVDNSSTLDNQTMPSFLMAAYRLRGTLPPGGNSVNRAVAVLADNRLRRLTELRVDSESPLAKEENPLVSMNCWGFTPRIFEPLAARFDEFRGNAKASDEFMLPAEITRLVESFGAEVEVLETKGVWLGITAPGDITWVSTQLARLHDEGVYPWKL